jgi:hypothetical protein
MRRNLSAFVEHANDLDMAVCVEALAHEIVQTAWFGTVLFTNAAHFAANRKSFMQYVHIVQSEQSSNSQNCPSFPGVPRVLRSFVPSARQLGF